jgi:hypothetical protein
MERSVNDQNSSTNIFTSYHYVVLYLLFYYDGLNKAVFVSSIRARAQADSFQRGSYALMVLEVHGQEVSERSTETCESI